MIAISFAVSKNADKSVYSDLKTLIEESEYSDMMGIVNKYDIPKELTTLLVQLGQDGEQDIKLEPQIISMLNELIE